MKIFGLGCVVVSQDGGAQIHFLAFFDDKTSAEKELQLRQQGFAEVIRWTVVTPSGEPVGPVAKIFQGLGIAQVTFVVVEIETKSAIVTPEPGIILPH